MFAGVCQLEPGLPHRRLDIKVYPRHAFAWALVHFTGSANFNRSMRLFAKKKGLRMSDEGIFPAIRDREETT
jgi:DNA polymerase/3'-5' exonuclease PolX